MSSAATHLSVVSGTVSDMFDMVTPAAITESYGTSLTFHRSVSGLLDGFCGFTDNAGAIAAAGYAKVDNLSCGDCDTTNPAYGPNDEQWQTATRTDVSACKATCTANAECGGFNFVEADGKCYFRNNDMSCAQSTDTDRDCYIKPHDCQSSVCEATSTNGEVVSASTTGTESIAKSTSERQMPTTHTAMRVALSRPRSSRAK